MSIYQKIVLILALSTITTACMGPVAMVTIDNLERIKWEKPALRGDPDAQYHLGKASCCGHGVFYDTKKALDWLCKAAESKHPDAAFEIAKIYDHKYAVSSDDGVPEENSLSYAWYQRASQYGHERAAYAMNSLIHRISDEEIDYAEALMMQKNLPCSAEDANRIYRNKRMSLLMGEG